MDNSFEENLKKGRLFIIRLEELQYSYFNDRPEWITIHMNDLKLFIASFYYERPSSNVIDNNKYSDMDNTEILFKLYNNEIQENILNMKKIIEMKIEPDSYGNIDVGVTMTHSICKKKCDICQNFPDKDIHKWLLLRIKSIKSKCIFIDYEHNRTYSNWEEYLENNNLPNGFMFYPYSGFYDPSKTLYQNITPASKKIEKILKVADIASKILDWTGCIIVAASWVFPIAVPVLLPTLAVCTSSSIYGAGRQINQLIDMYKYDNKVSVTRAAYEWIDLAISVIGAITTPAHIFTAVTTEISSIQKTRSFLTIFRKSAYVTQCTLEVFRFTLELIDNNFEVTLENVLNLRLDLFLITGILMASSDVKNILNVLFQKAVWLPIYKIMEKIPYCMAPILWQSVYFIKNHLAVFVERVIMFLTDNLTPENLLTAWKNIRLIFDNYQKQTTQLGVVELLRHVVENIAEQESVKYVLRGERMVKLLESLREVAVNRSIRLALVKYCVERVLQEAKKLSAMHNDCVAELARLGETNVCEVDKMFCEIHRIERCAMDQYALWAIDQIGKKPPVALMAEYQEHASRPENMFDDEMVVKETVGASRSVKAYTFVAPCSVLDLELCLQFAEKVNPQHHYISHEFVQPEAGVSILLKVSVFSVDIIFFGVDLINGVPKMSICFFQENRDSTSSIENCKGLKKLLKAP